jgi:hypothetical protein
MSLKPGPDNPALVASYTKDQVRDEARRLANNDMLTGLEYHAAIFHRLLEMTEAK